MNTIEAAAHAAHEANRAYCRCIGDNSHLPWDEAPEWQKESARAGVRLIIAEPDTTPEESHKSWLAHKEAEGWVWGPDKDPVKKQHPCMVPYEQLPLEQRVKDEIYGLVVRAMLRAFAPVEAA
jgi:hypothetical protein